MYSCEQGLSYFDLQADDGIRCFLVTVVQTCAIPILGVYPSQVSPALAGFRSVKRRLEPLGTHAGVAVYDDFAHHPTAIRTTLEGLRAKVDDARIVVAMEPRSNSMRLGAHADALAPSLALADVVVFLQ